MPHSMTGFGAAEGPVGGGRLRVELRTVNHRYFNLSLKLPQEMSALEVEFREVLRREFERGHVTVSVRWVERPVEEVAVAINLDRARAVVARLRELKAVFDLPGDVDLPLVARQSEVFAAPQDEASTLEWSAIGPVVTAAATACKLMREREGAALTEELLLRLSLMEQSVHIVEVQAPTRVVRERDRLTLAVQTLLKGSAPDEPRMAQEIAILADKLDITEELVRFRAHLAACRGALATVAPGKQLGFLAQELGREINTMGSKANDAVITQQVIQMKGELEKFREQLENLQ
ncbi:MAG: YicC/YloC family endoribonuclease [Gemmatimonadota bacterium]